MGWAELILMVLLIGFVLLCVSAAFAPEGYEDESGFHLGSLRAANDDARIGRMRGFFERQF